MEIKNRYIKYIPEITSDIYDIIWKKCLSLKIEGKPYDFTDNSFEAFKKERYFFIGPSGGYSFGVDNNESKDTEITVRELLGFDPFVKDELIKSNFNQTTACEQCKYTIGYTCLRNACNARNGQYYPKEDPKKEIIPEYVEFNNQIHKVKNWTPNTYCILENGQEPFKHLVKPSTKEAYDLQQKPKNQAVHCTTQEEWDFVLSKFNPSGLLKEWNSYKEKSCINLNAGWYSELSFYIEENYQILSFQEWCDLNNYSMEKDWTKVSKKELLEEAKRRYPIGTKFISAINFSHKDIVECNYHQFYNNKSDEIVVNSNTGSSIYKAGKWAEIISLPEEKVEEKFKFEVGKWYKVTYDTQSQYYLKYINNDYEFGYSEYICMDNNEYSMFSSGNKLKDMSIPILVSLEEIQQYLPEGHIDKIKIVNYQTCPEPELKEGQSLLRLQVIKDIDPKNLECKGQSPFIPKGSITWIIHTENNNYLELITKNKNHVHIENNRYYANYPSKYFQILDVIKYKEPEKANKIELTDNDLGNYFSFDYDNNLYSKAKFIKEGDYYYLINNCYSNCNGHSDKSTYIYSLRFTTLVSLNRGCKNFKRLAKDESCTEPINEQSLEDYIVVTKEHPGLNGILNYCYKRFLLSSKEKWFKFAPYDTIDLTKVETRHATQQEIAKYKEIGKPYDTSVYFKVQNQSAIEIGNKIHGIHFNEIILPENYISCQGKLIYSREERSIFPTFDEPVIKLKKRTATKNYFRNFEDPYINK